MPSKREILEDVYKDYKYIITSRRWHCAYILVPKGDVFYKKLCEDMNDLVKVHGGIVYSRQIGTCFVVPDDYWCIGFDYMHKDDVDTIINGSEVEVKQKPHITFDVVRAETEKLIDQMIEINNKK